MKLRMGTVAREVVLAAPREEVWAALTDSGRLAEWFANEVELDARPGGEGVFRWADGEERRAIVHEVVPGERLSFSWADGEGATTTVGLELSETDDGTRLVVTETAGAPGEAPVTEWSVAVCLGALAQHLDPVLV